MNFFKTEFWSLIIIANIYFVQNDNFGLVWLIFAISVFLIELLMQYRRTE